MPKKAIQWAKIRSIEPVAEEDVYDVEIAGTHNFVAGHYVDARTGIALTSEQEEIVALRRSLEPRARDVELKGEISSGIGLAALVSDKRSGRHPDTVLDRYEVSLTQNEIAALTGGDSRFHELSGLTSPGLGATTLANGIWMSSEDGQGVENTSLQPVM